MCLCMLLISLSQGILHQMHLLGNGAQRELLTSRLQKKEREREKNKDLIIALSQSP